MVFKKKKKPTNPHAHTENICYVKVTILLKSFIKIEIYQSLNGLKEILPEEICSQFATFDHLQLQVKGSTELPISYLIFYNLHILLCHHPNYATLERVALLSI